MCLLWPWCLYASPFNALGSLTIGQGKKSVLGMYLKCFLLKCWHGVRSQVRSVAKFFRVVLGSRFLRVRYDRKSLLVACALIAGPPCYLIRSVSHIVPAHALLGVY